MANQLIEGMCVDCVRNVTRVLVDGLRCGSCFRRAFPGQPLPISEPLPAPPVELPKPKSQPKSKIKALPKPKVKKARRPRPELAIWSGCELFYQALTVKALRAGHVQMAWWALKAFKGALSDVDRLLSRMQPGNRDSGEFIKRVAKELNWTRDYAHAAYRSFLDWEELQLAGLLQGGTLVKGRNFVQEAAVHLGWTKRDTWNAYKRLKRKGVKREVRTEHQILEVLSCGEEMTARQIADRLQTVTRWVYQVITTKLTDKVSYRECNNFGCRVYRIIR